VGINAGEPSGNWCAGPSTGGASARSGVSPPKNILRLSMQNPAIWCILGGKKLPSIMRSNYGNGVSMRSPRNDPCFAGVSHSPEYKTSTALLIRSSVWWLAGFPRRLSNDESDVLRVSSTATKSYSCLGVRVPPSLTCCVSFRQFFVLIAAQKLLNRPISV